MKGLLQSKLFKKNLYKWLFMYVGTLLLLTTVITYSKYITSLEKGDEARVAKFKINLTASDNSATNARATSNIDYYFSVDKSELEVASNLLLVVNVDSNFHILSIDNLTTNENIYMINGDESFNTYNFTENIALNNLGVSTYKVTIKYNGEVTRETDIASISNIVGVSYKLVQID